MNIKELLKKISPNKEATKETKPSVEDKMKAFSEQLKADMINKKKEELAKAELEKAELEKTTEQEAAKEVATEKPEVKAENVIKLQEPIDRSSKRYDTKRNVVRSKSIKKGEE